MLRLWAPLLEQKRRCSTFRSSRTDLNPTTAGNARPLLVQRGLRAMVDQNSVSWNQVSRWLRQVAGLRQVA